MARIPTPQNPSESTIEKIGRMLGTVEAMKEQIDYIQEQSQKREEQARRREERTANDIQVIRQESYQDASIIKASLTEIKNQIKILSDLEEKVAEVRQKVIDVAEWKENFARYLIVGGAVFGGVLYLVGDIIKEAVKHLFGMK